VTYFTITRDTEWVPGVLLRRLDAIMDDIAGGQTVLPLPGEEAQQLREELKERVRLTTLNGGRATTVRLDEPGDLAELGGEPVQEDEDDNDGDAVEEEPRGPI
jgi:hypothetical protein